MATQPATPGGGALERQTESTLADVITTILDKGLVIDVFARVSLVGIEVLRADARVVVASVDTYLRFAEATNRLEIGGSEPAGLPEVVENVQQSGSKQKTKGALEAAGDKLEELISSDQDEEELEPEPRRTKERSRS
jgi:gas vesicle structural protein